MADRSVRVVLDASVTGFTGAMTRATQSAVGFARTATTAIDNNRASMNQLAGTALRVGAGLTALAGFAVKSAMDWESAWTGVLKTVNGTPAQLAKVEQGLRDLATSMPESHQEIAAVAEAAGQLGIARENIVSFTKTMVMLGDTTNLTSEEAATSIAQFMNVMRTAPGEVDNLGAAIVQLGNNGASTERQIVEMAQRIAGAGRIVGLSEANVLGLASAVASTGVEVEAGGTAISQALIAASKAVATNSSELQTWADVAGVSAQQFADAWRKDPAQAFLAFERGLAKQGQGAFQTLDKLGLDGARVGRVLLNLAGANDLLAQSFTDSDQAMRENTALIAEAEKRYDTTAAKAKIAWNQIKDSAIDAGQSLLPVVAGIAEGVGGVSEAFRSLPAPIKGAAAVIAAAAGAALLGGAAFVKLSQAATNAGVAMGFMSVEQAGGIGAGLGRFARGATIAGVALTGVSMAMNAISRTDPASVKEWTAGFLDLGQGAKTAKADLEGLVNVRFDRDTFANLFSSLDVSAGLDKVNQFLGSISGGALDPLKSSRESMGAIDDALAHLVESGHLQEAGAGFDLLSAEAAKQGMSFDQLTTLLPGYMNAIDDVAAANRQTADAFKVAAAGSDVFADRLRELSADPDKALELFTKMNDKMRETSRSFSGFTTTMDEAGGSFEKWKKNLEDSVKAMADFDSNLMKLSARGAPDALIADLREKGPKAMGDVVAAMAQESDKGLAHIFDLWNDAAGLMTDVWNKIPSEKRFLFTMTGDRDVQAKIARMMVDLGFFDKDIVAVLKAQGTAPQDIKAILKLVHEYENSDPEASFYADTDPAKNDVENFVDWVTGEGGDVNVGGDTKPGKKHTRSLLDYINGKNASVGVHANTVPATKEVNAWLARQRGKSVHIPIIGDFRIWGASGLRVPPGYAGGRVPGTPPSDPGADNVMAVSERGTPLMVRSREWIVNEKASDRNDNWLAAMNYGGLNLNTLFGSPSDYGFARGRAGLTSSRAGSRSGQVGPMVVSTDLTGLEIGFDSDGLARITRGQVDVMLAEASRASTQAFQLARRERPGRLS